MKFYAPAPGKPVRLEAGQHVVLPHADIRLLARILRYPTEDECGVPQSEAGIEHRIVTLGYPVEIGAPKVFGLLAGSPAPDAPEADDPRVPHPAAEKAAAQPAGGPTPAIKL